MMKRLKRLLSGASVEVSEENGLRMLHLGGDAIQSAMLLDAPDALALHYTRAMIGFMLFNAVPRDLLMIGLGGGSIARFVHARMPATRITTVEINAKVVAAARAFFGLPMDDERSQVIVADGGDYVPANPMSADVLLLDAFDDGVAVTALCTERFYNACYAALRDGGVFAQNFIADEPKFITYLQRLERSFEGRVLCLPTGDRVNMIVFGLKIDSRRLLVADLKRAATKLERKFGLPFNNMVADLLVTNERTTNYLKLTAQGD